MEFRTPIQIPRSDVSIDHATRILSMGSCFSERIGRMLSDAKFRIDMNPFGILYNPLSISCALQRLISATPFSESDLVFHHGMYHSMMHHGRFSSADPTVCLSRIAERFESAARRLPQTDFLLVTLGTAFVYRWNLTGAIVGNCHQFPADQFHRFRLSVQVIVEEWSRSIEMLRQRHPDVKLIFTISPIRYLKEGAVENQRSKSTLHLSIDALQCLFPEHTDYFPAYEIVMDELRDYRFYNDGMLHPSSAAVDYIWQRFSETYFSDDTKEAVAAWMPIRKALSHRPLHPDAASYRIFLENTLQRLSAFQERYPQICCDGEKQIVLQELTELKKDI